MPVDTSNAETIPVLLEATDLVERVAAGEQFVLLDARPRDEYDAGHAPGARWVEVGALKAAFDRGDTAEGWGERIGALGIDASTRVVVYDDNLNPRSCRTWWLLRHWGVVRAAVLNGGWPAWIAAGGEVSTDTPAPATTGPFPAQPQDSLHISGVALRSLIASGKAPQLIDTRSEMEFAQGAVQGAVRLDWVDLIDPATGKLRERDALARLLDGAGVDPLQPSITYCRTGGRASVMVLALEVLGCPQATNYDGGWTEWSTATQGGQQ